MNPDDFKQAWKAQSAQTRLTIDADLILKEVQRNERSFAAMIFCRDVREVGVALLLVPVWFYLGIATSSPWTWYLTVPGLLWIAGFMLVDRWRHKRRPPERGEPLRQTVESSLAQVEHQIWLLRNVLWWYLMPLAIPMLIFFGHSAWQRSDDFWEFLGNVAPSPVVLGVFAFVYWLNQWAVRTELEPRRQELLTLLTSLRDETTSEVSGEYPILMSAKPKCSRRRMFIAGLCFVALLSIGIAGIFFAFRHDHSEKSPFAAVRWQESQPEVRVGDEWFKLVSLDEIPASEIVAFSQATYGDKWRKRFEEDLVELLTRMGHPPQDTVTLVVQSLTSSETRTIEDLPMTRANRRAIRDAAQARERSEQPQKTRLSETPAVSSSPKE